jgi:hypothetical protein
LGDDDSFILVCSVSVARSFAWSTPAAVRTCHDQQAGNPPDQSEDESEQGEELCAESLVEPTTPQARQHHEQGHSSDPSHPSHCRSDRRWRLWGVVHNWAHRCECSRLLRSPISQRALAPMPFHYQPAGASPRLLPTSQLPHKPPTRNPGTVVNPASATATGRWSRQSIERLQAGQPASPMSVALFFRPAGRI